MANAVKPIPDGFHSITPALVCREAARAIEFYKSVFGATEIMRMPGPGGKVMHSELKIGDSKIFVSDPMETPVPAAPESGASNPIYLFVYFPDVDNIFNRAVASGARVEMPLQDMFWGDRYGKLTDPFGQQWGIATHVEDVAPDEMTRRRQAFLARAVAQN